MRVPTGQMIPGPQEPVEQNGVKMGDGATAVQWVPGDPDEGRTANLGG